MTTRRGFIQRTISSKKPWIDEGGIKTVEVLHEAFDHLAQGGRDLRKVEEPQAATEVAGVVDHGLDAQDSQIIRRRLECDLHGGCPWLPLLSAWSAYVGQGAW